MDDYTYLMDYDLTVDEVGDWLTALAQVIGDQAPGEYQGRHQSSES